MTVRPSFVLLGVALALALPQASAIAANGTDTAMVRGNEIVVTTGLYETHELTHDGISKSLPVWSKDGSKIAFVEKTDATIALARLVVVDRAGHTLSGILIHPAVSGEGSDGDMRFVESIEWLDANRIAVAGSINPSTSEYIVLNILSHAVVDQFFDDASAAAFSPDGTHVAYQTGSPHFTPTGHQFPILNLDGGAIYPQKRLHIEFISNVRWSQDGQSLAVVTANYQDNADSVVIWNKAQRLKVIPLTISNGTFGLFWRGSNLIVTSAPDEQNRFGRAWIVAGGSDTLNATPVAGATDPVVAANLLKASLKQLARAAGGHEADFWCSSCSLIALPRRNSLSG